MPVLDLVLRGRFTLLLFLAAILLDQAGLGAGVTFFSLNSAVYLAPYFILGMICARMLPEVTALGPLRFLPVLVLVVVFGAELARHFPEAGLLAAGRGAPSSLLIGLGVCLAFWLAMPRVGLLVRLAPYTFTIYLYHVLFTSAARRLLSWAGVTELPVLILGGLLAGVVGPMALHAASLRFSLTRRAVLGLRS